MSSAAMLPSMPDIPPMDRMHHRTTTTSASVERDPRPSLNDAIDEFCPDMTTGAVEWADEEVTCSLDNAKFRSMYPTPSSLSGVRDPRLFVVFSRGAELPGFGFADQRPQRVCDACASKTPAELDCLATFWQTMANKNASAEMLMVAMMNIANGDFHFANVKTSNWMRMKERVANMTQLEVGICQALLKDALEMNDESPLTPEQLDIVALERTTRLKNTVTMVKGLRLEDDSSFVMPMDFDNRYDAVAELRQKTVATSELDEHEQAMKELVDRPRHELTTADVINIWGRYQKFGEDRHQALGQSLENRVKQILNQVVRRDQVAANAELEAALIDKNVEKIRKAMATSESVLGLLANSEYRDYVMPDIHVVVPGFAAHRRSAVRLIAPSARKRNSSLYPPMQVD